jgi:hypothetical protein
MEVAMTQGDIYNLQALINAAISQAERLDMRLVAVRLSEALDSVAKPIMRENQD